MKKRFFSGFLSLLFYMFLSGSIASQQLPKDERWEYEESPYGPILMYSGEGKLIFHDGLSYLDTEERVRIDSEFYIVVLCDPRTDERPWSVINVRINTQGSPLIDYGIPEGDSELIVAEANDDVRTRWLLSVSEDEAVIKPKFVSNDFSTAKDLIVSHDVVFKKMIAASKRNLTLIESAVDLANITFSDAYSDAIKNPSIGPFLDGLVLPEQLGRMSIFIVGGFDRVGDPFEGNCPYPRMFR